MTYLPRGPLVGSVAVQGDLAVTGKLGINGATPPAQPARIGQLTDSTGGSTASNNGALVSVLTVLVADPTKIDDNFAKLAEKVNAIEALLSTQAGGVGHTE